MDLSNVATLYICVCMFLSEYLLETSSYSRDCRQARLASLIINIEMEYTFMQSNLGGPILKPVVVVFINEQR